MIWHFIQCFRIILFILSIWNTKQSILLHLFKVSYAFNASLYILGRLEAIWFQIKRCKIDTGILIHHSNVYCVIETNQDLFVYHLLYIMLHFNIGNLHTTGINVVFAYDAKKSHWVDIYWLSMLLHLFAPTSYVKNENWIVYADTFTEWIKRKRSKFFCCFKSHWCTNLMRLQQNFSL